MYEADKVAISCKIKTVGLNNFACTQAQTIIVVVVVVGGGGGGGGGGDSGGGLFV
jgi:hypothetical protein